MGKYCLPTCICMWAAHHERILIFIVLICHQRQVIEFVSELSPSFVVVPSFSGYVTSLLDLLISFMMLVMMLVVLVGNFKISRTAAEVIVHFNLQIRKSITFSIHGWKLLSFQGPALPAAVVQNLHTSCSKGDASVIQSHPILTWD